MPLVAAFLERPRRRDLAVRENGREREGKKQMKDESSRLQQGLDDSRRFRNVAGGFPCLPLLALRRAGLGFRCRSYASSSRKSAVRLCAQRNIQYPRLTGTFHSRPRPRASNYVRLHTCSAATGTFSHCLPSGAIAISRLAWAPKGPLRLRELAQDKARDCITNSAVFMIFQRFAWRSESASIHSAGTRHLFVLFVVPRLQGEFSLTLVSPLGFPLPPPYFSKYHPRSRS
jgi:hypothetical protein